MAQTPAVRGASPSLPQMLLWLGLLESHAESNAAKEQPSPHGSQEPAGALVSAGNSYHPLSCQLPQVRE
jgi:hypothetical protein